MVGWLNDVGVHVDVLVVSKSVMTLFGEYQLQFGYIIILMITSVQTSEKGINAVAMIQYLVYCHCVEVERYYEDAHCLPWLLWEDRVANLDSSFVIDEVMLLKRWKSHVLMMTHISAYSSKVQQ
jgi:hypothetical protein